MNKEIYDSFWQLVNQTVVIQNLRDSTNLLDEKDCLVFSVSNEQIHIHPKLFTFIVSSKNAQSKVKMEYIGNSIHCYYILDNGVKLVSIF